MALITTPSYTPLLLYLMSFLLLLVIYIYSIKYFVCILTHNYLHPVTPTSPPSTTLGPLAQCYYLFFPSLFHFPPFINLLINILIIDDLWRLLVLCLVVVELTNLVCIHLGGVRSLQSLLFSLHSNVMFTYLVYGFNYYFIKSFCFLRIFVLIIHYKSFHLVLNYL